MEKIAELAKRKDYFVEISEDKKQLDYQKVRIE